MMKKAIGLALLAGAATVGTAGVASADTSANVALTSNYVWRGVSQSDGDFAVSGGFDWSHDLFYAGTWASSVGDSAAVPGADAELDVYAGVKPTLGPVSFDLGVIGYLYPSGDADFDWMELKLAASFTPIEPLTIGAAAYLSDEAFAISDNESTYLEVNAAYAITDALSVSGAFGNFDQDVAGEYDTWNLGVRYSAFGFGFDLRYHEADLPAPAPEDEISFTISRAL
jgi:uncharacterized protein (TIGR02001 family)